jgi:hypothetical protein
VTRGYCRFFFLILLVKRFSCAYDRLLIARRKPGDEMLQQVDVLSSAVKISVEGPGLREFAPQCLYAA